MARFKEDIYDAVIVGAGFCGITAARDLSRRGLKVAVLEARDRIGGRTWLVDSPLGMELEQGGAYVHWMQSWVWTEMVSYGFRLKPMGHPEEVRWIVDGKLHVADIEEYARLTKPIIDALGEGSLESFPNPAEPFPLTEKALRDDAISVRAFIEALDAPPEAKAAVIGQIDCMFQGESATGALSTLRRLSAMSGGTLEMFFHVAADYTIEGGGTKALIGAIAADIKGEVHLSTPVARIAYGADSATLTTLAGDVVRARRVIVTVPINALKSLDFQPPLPPSKIGLSEETQNTAGFKIWVRVKGKIKPPMLSAPTSHPIQLLGFAYELEGDTVLVGFGTQCGVLDIKDPAAVQQVLRLWLPDAEVLATDGHEWGSDPYAQQTWAMLRVGQLRKYGEAIIEPEGALRIAGGDYTLGWYGHFDGAIESGRRAARAIIDELAP